MWNAVKQILASKKALATIVAMLVWVIGKAGFDIDSDLLYPPIATLISYVVGQGIADHGKEAAKVLAQPLAKSDPS